MLEVKPGWEMLVLGSRVREIGGCGGRGIFGDWRVEIVEVRMFLAVSYALSRAIVSVKEEGRWM